MVGVWIGFFLKDYVLPDGLTSRGAATSRRVYLFLLG
jgi:hypothetical protein